VQKKLKKIRQGIEIHNSIGRGSWTHATYNRKCRVTNPRHMKFRRGA